MMEADYAALEHAFRAWCKRHKVGDAVLLTKHGTPIPSDPSMVPYLMAGMIHVAEVCGEYGIVLLMKSGETVKSEADGTA